MTRAGWWREVFLVGVIYLLAFLLGGLLQNYLLPLFIASVFLLGYWLRQLLRVANWMRRADREPPEASGIWGEIFDRIYYLQRQDREERDRLQTTVSYLRDSFAALKNATVLIDPSDNIEWCNSAAETLLGLEYPRDRGQAILNLLRLPDFHAYFTGEVYDKPLLIEGPRNAEVRLLVEVTPFGKGSHLLFARDVTREERMEEMRRDFVANVSHELRTPLTVITGYLLTLMESGMADDAKLARPLQQMQQHAQRMENLLRDLLWLSRLESVEPDSESLAQVNVLELLQEVRGEALGLEPEREISIAAAPELGLRGNYQYLHSAVSNLVFNALKYSEGPIALEASADEAQLQLSVMDQGKGIDEMHLPRLTERFYRVEQSRSQATGGTGLGLAIVKHVMAAHGGHLEISSRLGKGSTFRCIFPVS
ncbi:MAG: phosphate regulon sensor histidine kinase PhoR [Halieaceae bacterium]